MSQVKASPSIPQCRRGLQYNNNLFTAIYIQTFRKNGHCVKIPCIGQEFIFDKFEGADLYDNSVFQILVQKYQNWSQI